MKKINLALCGFGTVGRGVYTLLRSNKNLLKERLGIEFSIEKILVKDLNKNRNIDINKNIFTTNSEEIFENNIDIVVELIGGTDKAQDIILKALKNKIAVVTANKALLALNGYEIIKKAEKNKTDLFFEASVAGGIPIIKILKESLSGNNIEYMYGILNGTCNYILTKMSEDSLSFENVLKEAQEKGYAEQNPAFDIEGIDAAHKLAILLSLVYDIKVDFNDIYIEGISKITDEDIKFADEFGYGVKLLAIAKKENNGKIEGRVHPVLIEKNSILSNIKGVYNAVYIKSDFLGHSLYYGKGAGSFPTASSVVSDIIDAAVNIEKKCSLRKPVYSKRFSRMKKNKLKSINDLFTKYYLRFSVKDQPGVLSKISGILGKNNISIESVIQKGRAASDNPSQAVSIVMITHDCFEKNIKKAVQTINNLSMTMENTFFIRIENFNGKN